MSVKEFEGKNEEEAINKAIESLGLDRDDIDVEIVETRKAPFLFGGGRVRIRVHLEEERQPELEEREERQPEQPREGRGRDGGGGGDPASAHLHSRHSRRANRCRRKGISRRPWSSTCRAWWSAWASPAGWASASVRKARSG